MVAEPRAGTGDRHLEAAAHETGAYAVILA
jgi:hypothetical protein